MPYGAGALFRRPMKRDLAAELESRKMEPGMGWRLRAPFDLGQVITPGAIDPAPDLEDAPCTGFECLGIDGGDPARGLVGHIHETLAIVVDEQRLRWIVAQRVVNCQPGGIQDFPIPAPAVVSIDHRFQPPRDDPHTFIRPESDHIESLPLLGNPAEIGIEVPIRTKRTVFFMLRLNVDLERWLISPCKESRST